MLDGLQQGVGLFAKFWKVPLGVVRVTIRGWSWRPGGCGAQGLDPPGEVPCEFPNDEVLDRLPADAQIVCASARLAVVATAIVVSGHNREASGTLVADEEPGQEVGGG